MESHGYPNPQQSLVVNSGSQTIQKAKQGKISKIEMQLQSAYSKNPGASRFRNQKMATTQGVTTPIKSQVQ